MKRYDKLSEEDLLKLLKESDQAAFEALYNLYWEIMYGTAYKRVKNSQTAEEIVQDLFTDLWYRREMLPAISSLSGYLHSAVHYRVINHIQKEIRKGRFEQYVALYHLDFDNSTEDELLYNDLHIYIDKEVETLPVKCREVFKLSRTHNKSNKEIAQTLGITEKAVEKHITKALKHLRASLNTFFLLF